MEKPSYLCTIKHRQYQLTFKTIKKMKPYSNKQDRVDAAKCLYSEMKSSDKARKKAARKAGKDEIKKELNN